MVAHLVADATLGKPQRPVPRWADLDQVDDHAEDSSDFMVLLQLSYVDRMLVSCSFTSRTAFQNETSRSATFPGSRWP